MLAVACRLIVLIQYMIALQPVRQEQSAIKEYRVVRGTSVQKAQFIQFSMELTVADGG